MFSRGKRGFFQKIPVQTFNIRHHITLAILTAIIFLLPPPPSAAASSLLSAGRWIKVHTDTTSVYRLPYTLLHEWGFDYPDKIVIAGYGSVERAHSLDSAPDDLPVLPVYRDNDAIYFYAEGDIRLDFNNTPGSGSIPFDTHYNYYSKGSCYFIGERTGISSPDMETSDLAPDVNSTAINTHYAVSHHVYRENHPSTHGLLSYSRNITTDSPLTVTFDIPRHCGLGFLYYSYIWRHDNAIPQSIAVNFSQAVTSVYGTPDRHTQNSTILHRLYTHKEQSSFTLNFADEADRFSATFSNPSGLFSVFALSNCTFACERVSHILSEPYTLHLPHAVSGGSITMQGILPGLVAWDVTQPRNPINLKVHSSGSNVTTLCPPSGSPSLKIHTFLPSDNIPVPEYRGEIPSQDLHSSAGADLLIVTTEATYDAALRLAAAHTRWQGMKVSVVRQSEIFNEYSSGALHPNGLRHFVSRLAADRECPLRYLLLFGQGSRDTRADFDTSGAEYMVTYGTESTSEQCDETKFYSSDLYFGTLAEHIDPSLASMRADATVSVGRIPAADSFSAEAYVDKCIAYLSSPVNAGHYNHAIISGGIGDASQHLMASENIGSLIASHTASPTLNRAHLSLFTLSNTQTKESKQLHAYLTSRLGGDARLFSYTGHSSRDQISHYSHTMNREKEMAYGSLPVVYMSSCSTTPIDISDNSLGSTMILHNPGPIAVIGAGDEVYLNYNITLNNRFIDLFYTSAGGECLGDVFRLAVNSTKSSVAQFTNNLCYNFLGDPALPRYLPEATVNVTAIGSNDNLATVDKVDVAALSKTRVSGNVSRPDGSVDTSFSGKLYINVYSTPCTRSTLKHDNTDLIKDLTVDDDLIYTSVANVTDGLWSTDLTLPDVSVTGINRMTLNAISDTHVIASGGFNRLSVTDRSDDDGREPDMTPPSISLWLDSPDKSDGAVVSSAPILYIEISDSGSGTSLNNSSVGMMPVISLDGSSLPAASGLIHPEDEGVARGVCRLDNLTDGPHSITVRARDIYGNSASETINFTVVTVDPTATLTPSSRLVRDEVTFSLSHSLPVAVRSERLVIRDMEGNTVLSTDSAPFPFTWDLSDSDGLPVPDGTYRASVIINARPYYTATPETVFTIVKKQ